MVHVSIVDNTEASRFAPWSFSHWATVRATVADYPDFIGFFEDW
jgi:hypothetical protein